MVRKGGEGGMQKCLGKLEISGILLEGSCEPIARLETRMQMWKRIYMIMDDGRVPDIVSMRGRGREGLRPGRLCPKCCAFGVSRIDRYQY